MVLLQMVRLGACRRTIFFAVLPTLTHGSHLRHGLLMVLLKLTVATRDSIVANCSRETYYLGGLVGAIRYSCFRQEIILTLSLISSLTNRRAMSAKTQNIVC